MAIDFADFFTKAGKAFHAGNTTNTALLTTIEDEVEDFVQEFGSEPIEISQVTGGVFQGLRQLQSNGAAANSAYVRAPLQALMVQVVKDDNPQPDDSLLTALREFIRQMLVANSVDANTVSVSVAYGGSNVGNGAIVASAKRGDGLSQQLMFAEAMGITVTATDSTGRAQLIGSGAQAEPNPMSSFWPRGSGAIVNLTSFTAASGENKITNGGFETPDTVQAALPQSWISSVGTVGTTTLLTNVEIQTIVMSGSPSAGLYRINFVNRFSKTNTTAPLAYNATQADVQSALRAIPGLEEITVVTTGTTPNLTHTITLTGVTNPSQFTSTNGTTGGTITHNTTTLGSAYATRGARALEINSDGATLDTIQTPVSLLPTRQYAFNLFAATDSAPAAGVITVDLVDGIGGSVIADDEGTNNTFTIDCTALTTTRTAKSGVFRTPTALPAQVYLRIRQTTAISNTSSVFIDEATLVEMVEAYAGGPALAVFTGPTEWALSDTGTVTTANNRAGTLHEWMDRAFDLRLNRLMLPVNDAGGETIADSLIG